METKTVENKQYSLSKRDVIIGAMIGAVTAIAVSIFEVVQSLWIDGNITDLNLEKVWQAAIGGLIAYIGKNFFEPTKKVTITKE